MIADKVLEKIAGQAASEVGASRGRSGGLLGIGSEADADARPKVDVDLSRRLGRPRLAAGIAYPGSIRAAASRSATRSAAASQELTGVPVHRVDIDVTFLTDRQPATSRLGQPPEGGPAMSRTDAKSRRLRRRPSRIVPATIVAVVLLALGVLAAIAAIARLVNGTWASQVTGPARTVAGLTWGSAAVITAAPCWRCSG